MSFFSRRGRRAADAAARPATAPTERAPVPAPAELRIEGYDRGLRLVGDVDSFTVPSLRNAVGQRLRVDPTLELDCSSVRFIDSSGLRLLIDLTHLSRADGGDVTLLRPPGIMRRVIEISGISSFLTLSPSIDPSQN